MQRRRTPYPIVWIALVPIFAALLLGVWIVPSSGRDERRDIARAVDGYVIVRNSEKPRRGGEEIFRLISEARRPWLLDDTASQRQYRADVLVEKAFGTADTSAQINATLGYTHFGYVEMAPITAAAVRDQLPYPPHRVWCVWLAEDVESVLFVAEHHWLHRVELIVHVPENDGAATETVEEIGCTRP